MLADMKDSSRAHMYFRLSGHHSSRLTDMSVAEGDCEALAIESGSNRVASMGSSRRVAIDELLVALPMVRALHLTAEKCGEAVSVGGARWCGLFDLERSVRPILQQGRRRV